MNYNSSDFAGGVPMNEPDAVRCCAPAASAYSDGISAGYLDNPCIPAGSHNRSHKVMEHRKLEIRKVIGREILDSRGNPTGTGYAKRRNSWNGKVTKRCINRCV